MKVIDKRTERNNDWNVGDVICYWDDPSEKHYGLVIKPDLRTNGGCGIVAIGGNSDNGVLSHFVACTNMEDLHDFMKNKYVCVERVNAKLVIE